MKSNTRVQAVRKIAPASGFHTRMRTRVFMVAAFLFVGIPWTESFAQPLFRVAVFGGDFVFFGQKISLSELPLFLLPLFSICLGLGLASAVFGRIWCGYACPQTLLSEMLYRPLAAVSPKNVIVRHLLFLAAAAFIAFHGVAWIVGPLSLLTGHVQPFVWVLALLLTFLVYMDGAWLRERFCFYVCPYGRFQTVFQEPRTRVISYNELRGEPRSRKKAAPGEAVGDCIDCGLCVRVCPTGVDIRKGANQLDCISCGRCADACNGIMENLGREKKLISYKASHPEKKIPARIFLLGGMISAGLLVPLVVLFFRQPFHAKLVGVPGHAYIQDGDRIKNLINVKILNRKEPNSNYLLSIHSQQGLGAKLESSGTCGPIPEDGELICPVLISFLQNFNDAKSNVDIQITSQSSGIVFILNRALLAPEKNLHKP